MIASVHRDVDKIVGRVGDAVTIMIASRRRRRPFAEPELAFAAGREISIDVDEALGAFEDAAKLAALELAACDHIRPGRDAGRIAGAAMRFVNITAKLVAEAFVDLSIAIIVETITDLFGDGGAFAKLTCGALADAFAAPIG